MKDRTTLTNTAASFKITINRIVTSGAAARLSITAHARITLLHGLVVLLLVVAG